MLPDSRKNAVLQVCDAGFLPFTLHLMNQIIHFCPNRTFDLVIASEDDLALPQWALDAGILFHRMGADDLPPDLPVGVFVRATFYRIKAPDQLAHRYRRILYLDGDILMEGGDLERLLTIGMGDHPIAAVTARLVHKKLHGRAPEFRILGLPAAPYFNSGVMLIDTDAYLRDRMSDRCIEVIHTKREAILLADQSVYNIVLQGRFARLSPVWNWMTSREYPFATRRIPVRFRHFCGKFKPWNDTDAFDIRFRESYANFFRTHLPEALPLLSPGQPPRVVPLERMFADMMTHLRARRKLSAGFETFRDEWDVKL